MCAPIWLILIEKMSVCDDTRWIMTMQFIDILIITITLLFLKVVEM